MRNPRIPLLLTAVPCALLLVAFLSSRASSKRVHRPVPTGAVTEPSGLTLDPASLASADLGLDWDTSRRVAASVRSTRSAPRGAVAAFALGGDPTPGGLTGRVTAREDGRALAGVGVTLVRRDERVRVETDEAGVFAFEDLGHRLYRVAFRSEDRVPLVLDEVVVPPGQTVALDTALDRGHAVDVRVVDAGSGVPVADADLTLVQGGLTSLPFMGMASDVDLRTSYARSDAQGRARLGGIDARPHQLVVSADGYTNQRRELYLDSDESLVVELASGATITGSVSDSDGRPLAEAWVLLAPADALEVRSERSLVYRRESVPVEADGTFRITGVPAGRHHVGAVTEAGGVGAALEPVVVDAGSVATVRLVVPAPGRISGRITDTDGYPVSGVRVYLSSRDLRMPSGEYLGYWDDRAVEEVVRRMAFSDADGRYELEGVRTARDVTLRARAEGLDDWETDLRLEAGSDAVVDVQLTAKRSFVSGWVTDSDGEPIEKLKIVATSESLDSESEARTGEDGSFWIPVSEASAPLRVEVAIPGTLSSRFQVHPAEYEGIAAETEGLSFVVLRGTPLRGEVLSPDGEPITAFEYAFYDQRWKRFGHPTMVRDGAGRFDVSIAEGTAALLKFTAPGYLPKEVWGSDRWTEVVLERGPALRGRVRDPRGAPLSGALVCLSSLPVGGFPPGGASTPHARTDDSGGFELRGVPLDAEIVLSIAPLRDDLPPLVHHRLDTEGGLPQEVDVRLPEGHSVEIELAGVGDLGGDGATGGQPVLVDAQGWPLDPRVERSFRLLLGSEPPGGLDPGESVQAIRLAAGAYRLLYLHPDETEANRSFPFEVRPSPRNRFTFDVRP